MELTRYVAFLLSNFLVYEVGRILGPNQRAVGRTTCYKLVRS